MAHPAHGDDAAPPPGGTPAPPPGGTPAPGRDDGDPTVRDRATVPQHGDGVPPPPGAAPAPQRDDRAVGRFIEDFASALVEMGVPRMPARVSWRC